MPDGGDTAGAESEEAQRKQTETCCTPGELHREKRPFRRLRSGYRGVAWRDIHLWCY
jgi:hypothetical protein